MNESMNEIQSDIHFEHATLGELVCALLDQVAEPYRAGREYFAKASCVSNNWEIESLSANMRGFTREQIATLENIATKEEMKTFLVKNGFPNIVILSANPAVIVRQIVSNKRHTIPRKWNNDFDSPIVTFQFLWFAAETLLLLAAYH